MTEIDVGLLRGEVETLRRLLEVHEETALAQVEVAEQALEAMMRANAQVELQAAQMRQVIEASSEGVIVLGPDWVVQYVNTRAVGILGRGEGLVGRRLQEIDSPLLRAGSWKRYEQVMLDRVASAFEDVYQLQGKGTAERHFVIHAAPVGDGIAIFLRDVTERRRNDAMLQRTEKLAAVGRLASSISHEINNPLESVVNLLYLIEHSESAGGEMKTYAALAASELARVSHIVTHTLKFHRQSTRAADCRVSEILESVLSLYQGRLSTQRVEIVRDFAEDDAIVCFAGDMRQVFANLIGNALDAMRGQGQLRLRTRLSHHPKTGEPGLRVTVADSGCGMSKATRERIFEAFFTTKMATGTGLGLWVSDEIIRNHKGTVRVRSSEEVGASGTVFSLFFPKAQSR